MTLLARLEKKKRQQKQKEENPSSREAVDAIKREWEVALINYIHTAAKERALAAL